MIKPDSISIPEWRAVAAEYRRLADEIDSRIDALLEMIDMKPGAHGQIKKAKAPGIITGKWRDILFKLASSVQRRPFGALHVMAAAQESNGRVMRVADVRRQFEPYLLAGYFVEPSRDLYQFTDDGFAKIAFTPDEPLGFDELVKEDPQPLSDTSTTARDEARRALDSTVRAVGESMRSSSETRDYSAAMPVAVRSVQVPGLRESFSPQLVERFRVRPDKN